MVPWLKIEVTTPSKPQVINIACNLGLDPDAVFGKLFRIWAWFDQHTENGHARVTVKSLLDRDVFVTGFVDAVIAEGWLVVVGDELIMKNFDDHNSKTAKTRALEAQRQAKMRKKQDSVTDESRNSHDDSVTKNQQKREQILELELELRNNINTNTLLEGDDERIADTGNNQAAGKDRAPVAGTSEPEKAKSSFDAFELKADDEESKDGTNRNGKVIDEIYSAYPRKIAKGDAIKAIAKAIKKVTATELLEAVKAYAQSQVGNPEPQYIPYPASWFNSERWNDDRESWLAWKHKNRDSGMDLGQKFVSTQPMGEWL